MNEQRASKRPYLCAVTAVAVTPVPAGCVWSEPRAIFQSESNAEYQYNVEVASIQKKRIACLCRPV